MTIGGMTFIAMSVNHFIYLEKYRGPMFVQIRLVMLVILTRVIIILIL